MKSRTDPETKEEVKDEEVEELGESADEVIKNDEDGLVDELETDVKAAE